MQRNAKDIIQALSTGPVQRLIRQHENFDARELVLKNKAILGIPAAQLFEQIASRKKAKAKLPLFYDTEGVIFPPLLNFEQSSSQATALYKKEIISELVQTDAATIADLTGGFGVDSYFFSSAVSTLHFVEPELFLLEVARHNHILLGASNILYHPMRAETFLHDTLENFDLIYLDPSRKTAEKKKVLALTDSQPNVIALKNELFNKTPFILVKASPLLDIQAGISQLGSVKKVYVISVSNECKEVLFLCQRNFSNDAVIEAVNLGTPLEKFEFSLPAEKEQQVAFSDPLTYLYEPNASILKAGAFKSVGVSFGLKKIHPNTHLYTGEDLVRAFPGRKFLIERIVRSHPTEVRSFFPDGKANVTTRNYPLTPEELKKKMGLKDGGEKFLIGFSGEKKKFLAVATRV